MRSRLCPGPRVTGAALLGSLLTHAPVSVMWPCCHLLGQSRALGVTQVQDAQAAMRLYVLAKKEWERQARDRRPVQDKRPATTATEGGRDSTLPGGNAPSTGTRDRAVGQVASPQSGGRITVMEHGRARS